jgi:hypothetical protein
MVLRVLGGFDFTSWYAAVVYVVGGLLVLLAGVREALAAIRWARRKLHSPPASPETAVPPPDVVLGQPGGSLSFDTSSEPRRLAAVEPRYLIENKEATEGIRDVVTGVRTRDGREHGFDAFRAGLIAAKETAIVENVGSIPHDFLEGVHESAAFSAFLYWARFTRAETRWEVVYDPETRENTYAQMPPARPELNARVRRRPEDASTHLDTVVIENAGDTPIREVTIDLPPEAGGWNFLFDTLASYPIRELEPGGTVAIPIAVVINAPGSIEVLLRGRADGVPYQRRRTLSLFS